MIKHIKRVWNWLQESGANYRKETALRKAFAEDFPNSWSGTYVFEQKKNLDDLLLNRELPKKRPQVKKATTRKEKKMPLTKGTSDKTRSKNIAKEIKAGKKPSQAAAIGYAVQREAIAKKGAKAVKAKK